MLKFKILNTSFIDYEYNFIKRKPQKIIPNPPTIYKLIYLQFSVLDTDCRLDGISVGARFDSPANGAIFIKDHSSTCRQVFENSTEAHLEIPFPSSTDNNPKCPGTELSPSLWSFIVVLQKNEIGIPSLMTGTDRIFNVTCDYSKISTITKESK